MRALKTVLVSAVVAGLIGGAIASVFHGLFTEPVIDRAIAAEEARAAAQPGHHSPGHHSEEPVVSRRGQKIGLVVGLLLYGSIWGLLVGLAIHATRGWTPGAWSLARRGAVLAALLGWAVAIFPFIKYPANPPGVGEPDSIGYRQTLYIGFMALSVLGLALATAIRRRTGGWLAPGLFYVAWALGIYFLMPLNPDPVELSEAIVRPFRALSLAGLVIFWVVLGAALAVLGRDRATGSRRVARPGHA
jgi:predicted cobalt transporter CbtA